MSTIFPIFGRTRTYEQTNAALADRFHRTWTWLEWDHRWHAQWASSCPREVRLKKNMVTWTPKTKKMKHVGLTAWKSLQKCYFRHGKLETFFFVKLTSPELVTVATKTQCESWVDVNASSWARWIFDVFRFGGNGPQDLKANPELSDSRWFVEHLMKFGEFMKLFQKISSHFLTSECWTELRAFARTFRLPQRSMVLQRFFPFFLGIHWDDPTNEVEVVRSKSRRTRVQEKIIWNIMQKIHERKPSKTPNSQQQKAFQNIKTPVPAIDNQSILQLQPIHCTLVLWKLGKRSLSVSMCAVLFCDIMRNRYHRVEKALHGCWAGRWCRVVPCVVMCFLPHFSVADLECPQATVC